MQEVGYIKYNNVGEDYTGKWKSLGCIDGCLYKEDHHMRKALWNTSVFPATMIQGMKTTLHMDPEECE